MENRSLFINLRSALLIALLFIHPLFGGTIALIELLHNRRNWEIDVFCVAMLIAHFSYSLTTYNDDLNRYFDYIISMRGYSLSKLLEIGFFGQQLYVFEMMVWLANLFNDEHLIPWCCSGIVYYIALYCTCYVGYFKSYDWSCVTQYIIVVLMTLDWIAITNNLRNVTAFSIAGYALFKDVYINKKNFWTIFLYIVPIFLHSTSIIFILLRLILLIKNKEYRIVMACIVLSMYPIVGILKNNISIFGFSSFITFVIQKAYNYYYDIDSAFGLEVKASRFGMISRIFIGILVIFLLLLTLKQLKQVNMKNFALRHSNDDNLLLKKQKSKIIQENDFLFFLILIELLTITCLPMLRPEYWRFATACVVFGGLGVIPNMEKGNNILKKTLWIIAFSCMILRFRKFFWIKPTELIMDSIINCPITFFIKSVLGNLIT